MTDDNNRNNTLVIWIAAALVFAASLGVGLYSGSRIGRGSEAHEAICALQHDVQVRHDAGAKFLVNHPKGIPGIPVSVIKQGVKNQEATLEALKESGLTC